MFVAIDIQSSNGNFFHLKKKFKIAVCTFLLLILEQVLRYFEDEILLCSTLIVVTVLNE